MPELTANETLTSAGKRRGTAIGTIHKDAYTVLISQSVLDEILDYSERDLQRESGGFLIGGGDTTHRRFVEVRHFLPAVEARSRIASLMFTHDTWAAMTREVAERFPDQAVLGWHHTHPGFGIFCPPTISSSTGISLVNRGRSRWWSTLAARNWGSSSGVTARLSIAALFARRIPKTQRLAPGSQ